MKMLRLLNGLTHIKIDKNENTRDKLESFQ